MDKILYTSLVLTEKNKPQDTAIVESLKNSKWFNKVMLVCMSKDDMPDAMFNPLVLKAIDIIAANGQRLIWGRWLWVGWPKKCYLGVEKDFNYYADVVVNVRNEAMSLGASECMLDGEPYAHCFQKYMATEKLDAIDRQEMEDAIGLQVDYIYPSASTREDHFCWPLNKLGRRRLNSKTYLTKPGQTPPAVRPPTGYRHLPDYWGSNVTLAGIGGTLTPKEVKALVMPNDYLGQWVYVDYNMFADVINKWDV